MPPEELRSWEDFPTIDPTQNIGVMEITYEKLRAATRDRVHGAQIPNISKRLIEHPPANTSMLLQIIADPNQYQEYVIPAHRKHLTLNEARKFAAAISSEIRRAIETSIANGAKIYGTD